MTQPPPFFEKKFRGHVPGSVLAEFEVCSFSHFGAISI